MRSSPPPFFDSEEVKKLISAYDRFIPFQIQKILGRDRITEISLGDYVELLMNVLFMDAERARFAPSRSRELGDVVRFQNDKS